MKHHRGSYRYLGRPVTYGRRRGGAPWPRAAGRDGDRRQLPTSWLVGLSLAALALLALLVSAARDRDAPPEPTPPGASAAANRLPARVTRAAPRPVPLSTGRATSAQLARLRLAPAGASAGPGDLRHGAGQAAEGDARTPSLAQVG
jgi:hypothetical protein